jgi:Protein of unknown function (DUF1761)
MLNTMTELNLIGVLAATVASAILGGIWFTAIVAKPYAAALGRVYDPTAKPGALYIVGPLVCSLVVNLTTGALIAALQIATYGEAVMFGLIVGIGYLSAVMTNIAINPNMPHPFRYAAINAPYFILNAVVTSLIIVALS